MNTVLQTSVAFHHHNALLMSRQANIHSMHLRQEESL